MTGVPVNWLALRLRHGNSVLSRHACNVQPVLGHSFAHTVLSGDVPCRRPTTDLLQEQCPGQKQTSGQPGSLFLLDRITGQEGDVTQSLNSAQVVVEECVRKFVGNVALLTRFGRERVVYDDDAIRRRPECAGREQIGLNVFQFLEPLAREQLVPGSDLDTQQLGNVLGGNRLGGADP